MNATYTPNTETSLREAKPVLTQHVIAEEGELLISKMHPMVEFSPVIVSPLHTIQFLFHWPVAFFSLALKD